jgi:hypothetical protein
VLAPKKVRRSIIADTHVEDVSGGYARLFYLSIE